MALPLLYGAPNNVSIRFVTYCINEIMLLFCDLSILMHIAVVLWVFNHCMKIPQFISPTVLRHLGCFCGFAVTNSTPVSIFAQASCCRCLSKSFPSAERRSGITGSWGTASISIDSADLFSQVVALSHTPTGSMCQSTHAERKINV